MDPGIGFGSPGCVREVSSPCVFPLLDSWNPDGLENPYRPYICRAPYDHLFERFPTNIWFRNCFRVEPGFSGMHVRISPSSWKAHRGHFFGLFGDFSASAISSFAKEASTRSRSAKETCSLAVEHAPEALAVVVLGGPRLTKRGISSFILAVPTVAPGALTS